MVRVVSSTALIAVVIYLPSSIDAQSKVVPVLGDRPHRAAIRKLAPDPAEVVTANARLASPLVGELRSGRRL